jgi:hypothetical protein
MLYKYTPLERLKIRKAWGSHHNFHLAHPILIRPVELQRGNIIELNNEISDLEERNCKDKQKKGQREEQPPNQGLKGAFCFGNLHIF